MNILRIIKYVLIIICFCGCATKGAHNPILLKIEPLIDNRYIAYEIRDHIDPVVEKLHFGQSIETKVWDNLNITFVELAEDYDSEIIYENESARPLNDGFVTLLSNAKGVGLFVPKSSDQEFIELRINYFCSFGRHISVHVVSKNPLLLDSSGVTD